MTWEPEGRASLPPDAMRKIGERTGIALDGLENILIAAKLDSVGGYSALDLELRIDLTETGQRELAATQLTLLADRIRASEKK